MYTQPWESDSYINTFKRKKLWIETSHSGYFHNDLKIINIKWVVWGSCWEGTGYK